MAHKPVVLTRPSEEKGEQSFTPSSLLLIGYPALRMIIVPLDGSRFAEEALAQARRIASQTGATLALVCAIPPARNWGTDQVELMRISDDVARGCEAVRLARYLAQTAGSLRTEGLKVLTELVYGHPAEMVLLTARRLRGDLIMLAAHGRRDFERVWLGSVAQKLVQGSTLPVLIIRSADSQPVLQAREVSFQASA
jgi:nucleotide-binding universal stress UspA family protein